MSNKRINRMIERVPSLTNDELEHWLQMAEYDGHIDLVHAIIDEKNEREDDSE